MTAVNLFLKIVSAAFVILNKIADVSQKFFVLSLQALVFVLY